jgi:hypothetical protein
MVGVLEIIFGLDAVAGELRVARQALVFLEQLGGVPALAVILAIGAGIAGHSLRTLSAAATTSAALTIIDQNLVSLSHWRRSQPVTSILPFNGKCGPDAVDRPAPLWRKSTLPCRQTLFSVCSAMSSGVGGERIIFVRAVPFLCPM